MFSSNERACRKRASPLSLFLTLATSIIAPPPQKLGEPTTGLALESKTAGGPEEKCRRKGTNHVLTQERVFWKLAPPLSFFHTLNLLIFTLHTKVGKANTRNIVKVKKRSMVVIAMAVAYLKTNTITMRISLKIVGTQNTSSVTAEHAYNIS